MAVFDCHGRPVTSDNLTDVYSNRPFGKVFQAIGRTEEVKNRRNDINDSTARHGCALRGSVVRGRLRQLNQLEYP